MSTSVIVGLNVDQGFFMFHIPIIAAFFASSAPQVCHGSEIVLYNPEARTYLKNQVEITKTFCFEDGMQLKNSDLKFSFMDVELNDIKIASSQFGAVEFIGTSFTNSDLSHSSFSNTKFIGGKHHKLDLSNSEIYDLEYNGSDLRDINATRLSGTRLALRSTTSNNLDLSDSKLNALVFNKSKPAQTKINNVKIDHLSIFETSFFRLRIIESSITMLTALQARYYNLVVEGSNFLSADFSESHLMMASFRDTNFNKVDFSYSKLEDVYFTNVDIRGADFGHAKLCRVFFRDGDTRFARFHGAEFSSDSVLPFSSEEAVEVHQMILNDSVCED